MGTRVILGVEFERSHFISTEATGKRDCRNGHEAIAGKFCMECGGGLSPQIKQTPTDALRLLAGADADTATLNFPHNLPLGLSFRPLLIDTLDAGYDQARNLAFGCLLPDTITWGQLSCLMSRLANEAAKYGLKGEVALIIGHEEA